MDITKYREQLINLARLSIQFGLDNGEPLRTELSEYDDELRHLGASFVTLRIADQLRGCIGSLVAYRPLVIDIVENAFSAAFHDSRFLPLRQEEYSSLHYHISVLGEARAIHFESEQDLLDQLVPNVDGLILKLGDRRSTFLPSVWEQLPSRVDFLNHLKAKAGLAMDYWSDDIQVDRYHVQSIDSSGI